MSQSVEKNHNNFLPIGTLDFLAILAEQAHSTNQIGERDSKMKILIAISITVAASSMTMAEKENSPSKKSPNLAFTMELIFPLAGHIYAGEISKGMAPGLTYAIGVGTVMQGIEETDFFFGTSDGRGKIRAGLLIAAAGKLWGVISAYKVAAAHNEKIKIKIESDAKGTTMLKLSVPLDQFKELAMLTRTHNSLRNNKLGEQCKLAGSLAYSL